MLKTQLSEKIFAPLWQQAKNLINKKSLYHDILLGQKRIRLTFPNRALFSALTASFDHVAIATDLTVAADLTIYIWDADSVKTKAPVLDWDNIFAAGYRGKTFQSIFCQYFEYIRAISLLSYTENVGIYFLKSAKDLPWWVGASPLQVILNNWFKRNGCQLTHAGAIADDKSALILAGSGGAGKSTTVLSCLEHGLNYLSEDYCLLQANEDVPIVHTVYHSAKFEENTLKLFPQYQEHVINTRSSKSEKALVFYKNLFPSQIVGQAPVKAMLALKVTLNDTPKLEKIDFDAALRALSTSTIIQLPGADRTSFQLMQKFLSNLPCYHLSLGTDISANVNVIREVLSEETV